MNGTKFQAKSKQPLTAPGVARAERLRLIDMHEGELRALLAEVVGEFLEAQPAKVEASPYRTKAQIAEYLSVSVATVDNLSRREADPLPFLLCGEHRRYDLRQIDSWLGRQCSK